MNDEDKKLLTEFLVECWHEYTFEKQPEDECGEFSCWVCRCGHRTQFWQRQRQNRTFTTWQDLGDLISMLGKKEKVREFMIYLSMRGEGHVFPPSRTTDPEHFSIDLETLTPAAFISLVVEFLKQEDV